MCFFIPLQISIHCNNESGIHGEKAHCFALILLSQHPLLLLAQDHHQIGVNVFINAVIQITLRPLGIGFQPLLVTRSVKGKQPRQLAIKLQAIVMHPADPARQGVHLPHILQPAALRLGQYLPAVKPGSHNEQRRQ